MNGKTEALKQLEDAIARLTHTINYMRTGKIDGGNLRKHIYLMEQLEITRRTLYALSVTIKNG